MIVHVFQTHPRDAWCVDFHMRVYESLCDRIVVAVDSDRGYAAMIRDSWPKTVVVNFDGTEGVPETRVDEWGVWYRERDIRQASMDEAVKLNPSLILFGDTDEAPTPDATDWIKTISAEPQRGARWYAHWVNLFGNYNHAIGGDSVWSFESMRGNKKCLAMQPCSEMRYIGDRHTGMEPGRKGGGSAPTGSNRHLIDSPKLLHLKYGAEDFKTRPESRIARHQPETMLDSGRIVDIPDSWLWPEMP